MNPQELAQMLASGDPKKVKEAQTALKALGYPVAADGKLGDATSKAIAAYREDAKNEQNNKVTISNNEVIANDPVRSAIKGAVEIGPYAAGAGIGAYAGHKGAKGFNKLDAKNSGAVDRISTNPNVSGTVAEKQMGRMGNARNARTAGQFLAPAALLGSAEYIRSHVAPQFQDEETKKWINLGANADQGAGLGLLAHQLFDLKNRIGSPNDAESEAVIRTRAGDERAIASGKSPLSRALTAQTIDAEPVPARTALPAPAAPTAAPDAPPAATPTPGTQKHMAQQAKALGIKGAAGMRKSDLANALSEAVTEHGGRRVRAPRKPGGGTAASALIGGGIAADAAYNDARAEGASPMSAAGSAAAPMAVGGGAAVGLSKLAQALGPMAGKALNVAGGGLAAYDNASEAQGYRSAMPQEMQDSPAGQLLPHAMPLAMRGAQDIASIASAPGRMRSALSSAMTPGNATPEETQGAMYPEAVPPQQAAPQPPAAAPPQQSPMMQASALQVPEGIPENAAADAEMSARFPPGIEQRLQRMISLGANPNQIASFLNSAHQ